MSVTTWLGAIDVGGSSVAAAFAAALMNLSTASLSFSWALLKRPGAAASVSFSWALLKRPGTAAAGGMVHMVVAAAAVVAIFERKLRQGSVRGTVWVIFSEYVHPPE